MTNHQEMAKQYRKQFGLSLHYRLKVLSHRHQEVIEPNFISWEGEQLTGADTTAKIRELLKVIPSTA